MAGSFSLREELLEIHSGNDFQQPDKEDNDQQRNDAGGYDQYSEGFNIAVNDVNSLVYDVASRLGKSLQDGGERVAVLSGIGQGE